MQVSAPTPPPIIMNNGPRDLNGNEQSNDGCKETCVRI